MYEHVCVCLNEHINTTIIKPIPILDLTLHNSPPLPPHPPNCPLHNPPWLVCLEVNFLDEVPESQDLLEPVGDGQVVQEWQDALPSVHLAKVDAHSDGGQVLQ